MGPGTSLEKGAVNLVYRSTIIEGIFIAFLFADQSEHRKCEGVDA